MSDYMTVLETDYRGFGLTITPFGVAIFRKGRHVISTPTTDEAMDWIDECYQVLESVKEGR